MEVRAERGDLRPQEQSPGWVDRVRDREPVLMAVKDKEGSDVDGLEVMNELDPILVGFDLSLPSRRWKTHQFRCFAPEFTVPPQLMVALLVDDPSLLELVLNPRQPLLYRLYLTDHVPFRGISLMGRERVVIGEVPVDQDNGWLELFTK